MDVPQISSISHSVGRLPASPGSQANAQKSTRQIRVSRALPKRALARPYAFIDSTDPTAGASSAMPSAAEDRCRWCLTSGMRGTHDPNRKPLVANVIATAARARCRARTGAVVVTLSTLLDGPDAARGGLARKQ